MLDRYAVDRRVQRLRLIEEPWTRSDTVVRDLALTPRSLDSAWYARGLGQQRSVVIADPHPSGTSRRWWWAMSLYFRAAGQVKGIRIDAPPL